MLDIDLHESNDAKISFDYLYYIRLQLFFELVKLGFKEKKNQ